MTVSSFDVARARRETPSCERVIHFNNAGASLSPQATLNAVINYLRLEAEIGAYEAEERESQRIEHFYDAAAALLGCQRDEIAFVENATRAWDMAFYSIPFKPGDRILTAMAEYASNYIAYLQVARRTGAKVEVVPNDESGQLSVEALRKMMDERVKLIAMTHVPTNGGLVNPAVEVGKVARAAGVLYLLDACQSAGQMPLRVDEIGCDLLSATGRKYLRGPRATGFLYARRSRLEELEPPFLDLHAATWTARDKYEIRPDARRFENWETNFAGKLGLGLAIDYALKWGIEAIWKRVSALAALLRSELQKLPRIEVRDLGAVRCGIVTFTVEGKDPNEVRHAFYRQGINVWYSVAPSTLLDMNSRGISELVRASVHYFNTEEEVYRLCKVLASLA